jgi:hypothetical protein
LVVLLDCVIGEVDHAIAGVVKVVFFGRGADVAVVVPIALETAVDGGDQNVTPDVELPPVDEEAVLQVFLDDHTTSSVLETLQQLLLQLVAIRVHRDPETAIGVLTRLDDP